MGIIDAVKGAQNLEEMLQRAISVLVQLYTEKPHFIYELLQNAEDKGGHVYIQGVNDKVRAIFAITGFINLFEFK